MGVGNACVMAPVDISTGLYRVVAYTHTMLNEESVTFSKKIYPSLIHEKSVMQHMILIHNRTFE